MKRILYYFCTIFLFFPIKCDKVDGRKSKNHIIYGECGTKEVVCLGFVGRRHMAIGREEFSCIVFESCEVIIKIYPSSKSRISWLIYVENTYDSRQKVKFAPYNPPRGDQIDYLELNMEVNARTRQTMCGIYLNYRTERKEIILSKQTLQTFKFSRQASYVYDDRMVSNYSLCQFDSAIVVDSYKRNHLYLPLTFDFEHTNDRASTTIRTKIIEAKFTFQIELGDKEELIIPPRQPDWDLITLLRIILYVLLIADFIAIFYTINYVP